MCVWGRGAVFDWVQHEGATPRAPSDRENAPLAMALAFEAARSASRAICLDWGLCGYVFARSCRAQNTILLASGQKVPILPSSFTKQVWALSIHPIPRPTAGTTRCMHLVGDSDAPGWCREASYRALWTVGGPSAVPQGVLSDGFVAPAPACSDTRGNSRPRNRSFTPRLTRSREGHGRRRPHRRDRYATNQDST